MSASLNAKLGKVEWGEYKLKDLFEVLPYKKKFDSNKVVVLNHGEYPYIVRMGSNNGQKGYLNADTEYLNDGNTISFGQDTATMFYQEKPYFTGDKIKILKPKMARFGKNNAQFFLAAMRKSFSSFSWGSSSFSTEIIGGQIIILPTKDGQIDFDFMEAFVAELEAERLAELAAYLKVSGLDNYKLSDDEKRALDSYQYITWGGYRISSLFEIKNTANILSRDIVPNRGNTPYLCASAENNAVSSYIQYDEKYKEHGNCIFIGGKTFVVTYQEKDFFSNDSHNLALYLKGVPRDRFNQLFLATCVYKSLNHKYSWGNSISSQKIKGDIVFVPTEKGIPDYVSMPTLISAIQKLVIKDVVVYSDARIAATRQVIQRR